MPTPYPISLDERRAGLRVISDEEAPAYDTGTQPRHMTVIEDDAVEAIAAQCGMAALGLYTLMERRANRDGYAFGSYQDWADMGGMTRRHVIRLMDQLVEGGWVQKQERTTANGMTRANAWSLPNHRKPRTFGGDTASDTTSDIASDIGIGVSVTPKVVSSPKVDTSNGVNPPTPQAEKPKRSIKTDVPDDLESLIPFESWSKIGFEQHMSDDELRRETENLIDYYRGKGERMVDWVAVWRKWMRSPYRKPVVQNGRASPNGNPTAADFARMALELERQGL